ncbi:MAG: arsenate reductase (azurin) small subunit [Cocleimonas sp.]|nr:arsenate reductase (azurin) small subunit [Cocleimonas sp.]
MSELNKLKTEIKESVIHEQKDECETAESHNSCMMNRREFMLFGSAAIVSASTISLSLLPGGAHAGEAKAQVAGYPRLKIAKLSELKDNKVVDFQYPDKKKGSQCTLVKMGVEAGGGIGDKKDIVAFSTLCTHQGGPLMGTYQATDEHRTLGPCPLHLSLYDLRRHGIVASGQAYQSIPQVLLEVDGDDIYAVGMMGLLFGRHKNLLDA